MSDQQFDAARNNGEYPPKGWGWKSLQEQQKTLANHFWRINSHVEPWMEREAKRLGIPLPTRSFADADTYMPFVYGTDAVIAQSNRQEK
jgi:hypothetical protein